MYKVQFMGKISWLHISDIHIRPPENEKVIDGIDQSLVLERFLEFSL